MSPAPDEALAVYLHGVRVGRLLRRPGGRLLFTYDERRIIDGGDPISIHLPLREEPFEDDECEPYFSGLLPEGDFLRAVARAFHVSAGNPFSLLTAIGGECAGALALGADGGPAPGTHSPPPRWPSTEELCDLLDELPQRPLALLDPLGDEEGVRISLAGAHDKFGVLTRDGDLGLTLGDPASTHILKLPIARVAEPIANEAFCMRLAHHSGLLVAEVEPRALGSHEFLLVTRFDRDPLLPPDGRVHQEDFCQALGVRPEDKYEGEGGPGVADCGELLRRVSSAPARDVTGLLDALLFNFAIGNHDAHGKNYSLLLDGPGSIRLAPLYDLVCTTVFDGTRRRLAMKYGGENRPNYLRARHLVRLAEALELKPRFVLRRIESLTERVLAAADAARRSLPGDFAERRILDRIETQLRDGCDRLRQAASEDP